MARTPNVIAEEIIGDDITEDVAEEPFLPVGEMSIPVPKKFGKLWQKKVEDALKAYEAEHLIWDKVMELYRACGDEGSKLENGEEYKFRLTSDADENIIRNNIRTMMRTVYMKNPHIEFTDMDSTSQLGDCLEYIIQFLMNKQTYPGMNIKPKARRWFLHGQLTNWGILRIEFQPKEGSQEEGVNKLLELEKKLENAKSHKEINEIYAKLEIIHEEVPLLDRKGMHLYNVLPQCLIVDPLCSQYDLSDANWVAEWFDLDRDYMRQKYYKKNDEGRWVMRSNPEKEERELQEEQREVKDTVIDTVMSHETSELREVKRSNAVRCYYVYDKVLRRIYLFNSEDWSYPLWVADDDLGLSRFFRHFLLSFGEPIESLIQPGEVSFYVGQQNEINRINRKAKQIRDSIFGAILYNSKNVDKNEVQKLINHLRNPQETKAFGVSIDPERKVSDVLEVLAPPAFQHKEVFDTAALRSAIDRVSATSEVDRGGQFKTNTTNEAIAYYQQQKEQVATTLVDAMEDAFEALGWSMAEILVSKYSKEEITELVGQVHSQYFEPMTVADFNRRYRMVIAAGSIEKPSSEYKKQEAIKVAQALGQIGQGAPITAMKLIVRMFKEAFSTFLVKKEDWESLAAEGQANLQKGISTNGTGTQGPAAGNPQ